MTFTYKEMMDAPKLDESGRHCNWLSHEVHAKYYGQFVSESHIRAILSHIGAERLAASRDEHLNDIPLALWDRLPRIMDAAKIKELGGNLSLSTYTCVYKQAARRWLAANHPEIKRYRAYYEYRREPGEKRHRIGGYAIGLNEADALENFKARNKTAVLHELLGGES